MLWKHQIGKIELMLLAQTMDYKLFRNVETFHLWMTDSQAIEGLKRKKKTINHPYLFVVLK